MATTAAVFMSGNSQAVRLPKEFQFQSKRVQIERRGHEVVLREVMPTIQRIVSVSTLSTPSIWEVITDRGATKLILKGEEDIRRLSTWTLMITDSHGLRFMLPDMQALDKQSRRILDRFL